MRVMMAAFLAGGLLSMPALAVEKPPADTKTTADKPDAPKPAAHAPANRPIDYGDMRCAFAVRHRDVLDSQIIAWASGFLEGYAKANPDRISPSRLSELADPAVLRTHLRGYCLKHKDKSIEAALLAMGAHGGARPAEAPAPAAHPAAPAPQHPAAPKP